MVGLTDWALDAVERAIPSNGRLTPERAEHDISVAVRRDCRAVGARSQWSW